MVFFMGGYGCFGSCSIDLRIQLISAHGDDSMYFVKGANASFVIWLVMCLLVLLMPEETVSAEQITGSANVGGEVSYINVT